ncbi:MAG: TIGR00645 family protein [Chromatiaceae bacterium]|nr:TIGR00645 family protein [Chromatiaceae bacterium]
MKRLEHGLELMIFNSRWLLAPIYIGLVLSVLLLLFKFVQEFFHIVANMLGSSESDVILAVLTLVDLSLVANLLLIVIFSGYENFVSKIHTDEHEDRPEWMGKVDFSGLKLKLVASIVAISGIELLKAFVNIAAYTNTELAWKVGIHAVLVVSGVLLAWMDRIAASTKH